MTLLFNIASPARNRSTVQILHLLACCAVWIATLAGAGGLSGCAAISKDTDAAQSIPAVFVYEGQAQTVCMAGDFNGWSPRSHCLQIENGRWQIRLALEPGIYRYAFILDGTQWIADPKALFEESDGFGRRNGVIVIRTVH